MREGSISWSFKMIDIQMNLNFQAVIKQLTLRIKSKK